ncbi:hypothetical protein [Gryllotalpicola koreensis]|uniref:Uncharacterized protein n=1 Tax=Gryllotalpicola koreensis TaxID=993086 RepID=A0ABP8A239_9MICO
MLDELQRIGAKEYAARWQDEFEDYKADWRDVVVLSAATISGLIPLSLIALAVILVAR